MNAVRAADEMIDVLAMINAFIDKWPGSDYGPAHITLADLNVDDECINSCLAETVSELRGLHPDREFVRAELEATRDFMGELLKIPECEREASIERARQE